VSSVTRRTRSSNRVVLLALLAVCCERQATSTGTRGVGQGRPAPSPSAAPTPSAVPSSAPSAAAPVETGSASVRAAELLDAAKAEQAISGYRQFLKELCRAPGVSSGKGAEKLVAAGFAADSSGQSICHEPAQYQRPLASGSLLEPGADEVLLEVPSGRAVAAGEATLAVMRRTAAGYRLVRHLSNGGKYEARLRIVTPGHRDAVLVCAQSGAQGVYFGRCGFLGSGSFEAGAATSAADNELETVFVTLCGPGVSVSLGEVTNRGSRILATLVVEEFVLEATSADDVPGAFCTHKKQQKSQRFVIEYELDDKGRYRRVTPVPERVTQALRRY
jgi:hypothetical protein